MKLGLVVSALLACLVYGSSVFAEAKEMRIAHRVRINAPPDVVWAVVGNWGGIERWAPGTESSRLVLRERNETGAIRLLRRRSNGTQVTEKLLDYDPTNRRFAYTYVDGEVGASDYYSVLQVLDGGNGTSVVEWTGTFKRRAYWTDNPPPGMDDKASYQFLDGAYRSGLANLKKVIESGEQPAH